MGLVDSVQEEVLERLARVGVAARHAVESVLQGQHRSLRRGLSVEFAGHRPYLPGDDIRHLDWKVYARSDRYDIRLYEEETRLRATLIVDYSGSMAYRGDGSPSDKLQYARLLAAALAFLMVGQGDSVGIAITDDRVRHHLPPTATMGHLLNMLRLLEDEYPGGDTSLGAVIDELAVRMRRRGLVILISDAFDDPEGLAQALHHLHHRRQDVRFFQIIDGDEQDFPFQGNYEFVGLEGEAPLRLDADRVRGDYREAVAEHSRRVAAACHALGIAYTRCRTDEDLALGLVRALTTLSSPAGGRRR